MEICESLWPLYLFEGVNAGVAVRIPNRTCVLQKWADNGFVDMSLHLFVLEPQVPSEEAQGLVGLADYAVDMRIPLQVSRDGDTEVLGKGRSGTLGSWYPYPALLQQEKSCLLYTSPSPRDLSTSRMPSSA